MAISYVDARARLAAVLAAADIAFEDETITPAAVQSDPDLVVAEYPCFVMMDDGATVSVRHGSARLVTYRLAVTLVLGEQDVPDAAQMVRLFYEDLVARFDSEILLEDANGATCTECRGPDWSGAGIVTIAGRDYIGAEFQFEIDIQVATTYSP